MWWVPCFERVQNIITCHISSPVLPWRIQKFLMPKVCPSKIHIHMAVQNSGCKCGIPSVGIFSLCSPSPDIDTHIHWLLKLFPSNVWFWLAITTVMCASVVWIGLGFFSSQHYIYKANQVSVKRFTWLVWRLKYPIYSGVRERLTSSIYWFSSVIQSNQPPKFPLPWITWKPPVRTVGRGWFTLLPTHIKGTNWTGMEIIRLQVVGR